MTVSLVSAGDNNFPCVWLYWIYSPQDYTSLKKKLQNMRFSFQTLHRVGWDWALQFWSFKRPFGVYAKGKKSFLETQRSYMTVCSMAARSVAALPLVIWYSMSSENAELLINYFLTCINNFLTLKKKFIKSQTIPFLSLYFLWFEKLFFSLLNFKNMKLRNITYRKIKITNWMKCLRKSLVISFWCSFVVPFTTPSACKIKSLAILPWCSFCFPFTTTFLWKKNANLLHVFVGEWNEREAKSASKQNYFQISKWIKTRGCRTSNICKVNQDHSPNFPFAHHMFI